MKPFQEKGSRCHGISPLTFFFVSRLARAESGFRIMVSRASGKGRKGLSERSQRERIKKGKSKQTNRQTQGEEGRGERERVR